MSNHKEPENVKTRTIRFRVTEEEERMLLDRASTARLDMSKFCRRVMRLDRGPRLPVRPEDEAPL